jgi:tryptophan 2,3-dioxygenase
MNDKRDMTYGAYLQLDRILGSQYCRSDNHDEHLFILLHQTTELWIKQVLHEIDAAQAAIEENRLVPAYKPLARVSRIQTVMTQAWDVLATLTPADYLAFRESLGGSSGFQSAQFRRLEFRLGLKDARHLAHQEPGSIEHRLLDAALDQPSLYDSALQQVSNAGIEVPKDILRRDKREPHQASETVEAAWLQVYRDTETYWSLYQLAEKLFDLDDALLTWRFRHVVTVERMIGAKRGTGGTDGVSYLQSTLARRCFPELWTLRTKL